MTGSLAGLLVANGLYLVIGVALLPLLRVARTRSELAGRLGLGYIVGVGAMGALSAHLALIGVPVGITELVVVALVVGAFAVRRVRQLDRARGHLSADQVPGRGRSRPRSSLALVVLAHALFAFSVRPLVEWDGWAIWAMKARALYDFGGVDHGVFTTLPYGPLQHPLLLPALEATAFRAMGAFDGTLVHVQLALLAFGFAVGLWTLLRERVPAALAGAAILAIVAADSTLRQLAGNLADIPLAFFVALGVVALARSLLDEGSGLLPVAAIMLGAATLTKPEGLLFAAAALIPFVLIARTRASLLTALAVALILLPVAHLRRRARAQESRVQLRRRAEPFLSLRPLRSRGSRVLGRLAPGLVERLGPARAVRARRLRRSLAGHAVASRGVHGRLGAALVRGDRARLLDLGRPDRADAQVGRLPHGRLARHRRCSAAPLLPGSLIWNEFRLARTRRGLAAPKHPSNEAANPSATEGHAREARLTVCAGGART